MINNLNRFAYQIVPVQATNLYVGVEVQLHLELYIFRSVRCP